MSNLVKRMERRRAKAALPWMLRAVPSARPAPFLRAISFVLLALALGGVLLWSAPAEAQTATVLVKNTEQTATYHSEAQGFTTGAEATGYTLSFIGIRLRTIGDTSTAGSELTASLYDAMEFGIGLVPDSAVCTLSDPATFSASGLQTFNAPTTNPCPTLAASTVYYVVLSRANNDASTINFDITTSNDEDSGGAAGWSIRDLAHYQATGSASWVVDSSIKMLIEVKGFVAVATPGVTVSESAIAVTEGGTTDTYTVVLDAAPTGDVTIAVTETSADISLSHTTLTFGTANWNTAQTVTVTAEDDSIDEDNETVTIQHSVSTTADATNYPTTLAVDSVSVAVTDNDTKGVTVSKTSVTVSEAAGTDTYTITLDSQPTAMMCPSHLDSGLTLAPTGRDAFSRICRPDPRWPTQRQRLSEQ